MPLQYRNFAVPRSSVRTHASTARAGLHDGYAERTGNSACVLITIRASNKGIKGIVRACQTRGIALRPVARGAQAVIPTVGHIHAALRDVGPTFEAYASPEDLAYLCEHPSVVDVDFLETTACSIDARAAGSMPARS